MMLAIWSTMAFGVPPGSMTPIHAPMSKPVKPSAVAKGGTPGTRGVSLPIDKPYAFNFPALISGIVDAAVSTQ
ncbi:MAG: hypothetical protein RL585_2320 [Pseudomonadota bacterium]